MLEIDRITFVEGRDGVEKAVVFCKQGIMVYRAALRRKSPKNPKQGYARQAEYKRGFTESLIAFRKYLREHPVEGQTKERWKMPATGLTVAATKDTDLVNAIQHARDISFREGCTACGEQHLQLANWLVELQQLRASNCNEN